MDWLDKLPVEQVSLKAFKGLPDYSCAYPTGTIVGKTWKRRVDYYDESQGWLIGEYMKHPTDDTKVIIDWRRIKLISKGGPDD